MKKMIKCLDKNWYDRYDLGTCRLQKIYYNLLFTEISSSPISSASQKPRFKINWNKFQTDLNNSISLSNKILSTTTDIDTETESFSTSIC